INGPRASLALARVLDPPDGPRAVVGDHQRAVLVRRDADGTAPDIAGRGDEPDEEVLILARRLTVAEREPDDLVAGPPLPVPRPVERREPVVAVTRREAVAVVERHVERGGVGLDDHGGDGHLALELGMLPLVPWVLVIAEIEPGPAVELSF